MTILGRTIVRSDGYIGSPGYNVLHWSAGVGAGPTSEEAVEEWHDTVEASWTALAGSFTPDATFTIDPTVVYFDDSDGVIIGATTDPNSSRTWEGESTGGTIDRSACYTVNTRTSEYVNGRRLVGRIFVGPISNEVILSDGQIDADTALAVEGFMDGMISGLGGRLAVWHRPTIALPDSGAYGDVVSFKCNTVPGTLRSRKT